ncbi:MAG: biotin/lipoyl-containing protein [Caldilinea sp.]
MNVRVQIDGKTYIVEIGDLNSRPIQAIVDGQVFAVWPEEVEGVAAATPTASAAPKRAPATPSVSAAALSGQTNVVTAPLPGDVVVVAVKPGDVVEVGQLLCTVESMKMNNPIRSIQAGVVEQVLIAVGDHVNHGQPLLTLRQTNH